jgi:hypothetical protein
MKQFFAHRFPFRVKQPIPRSHFWNEWPSQPEAEGKDVLGFTAESLFAPPFEE